MLNRYIILPIHILERLNDTVWLRRANLVVREKSLEKERKPYRGVLRIPCLVRFEISSALVEPVQVHAIFVRMGEGEEEGGKRREVRKWGGELSEDKLEGWFERIL